jgi:hypothetical protein
MAVAAIAELEAWGKAKSAVMALRYGSGRADGGGVEVPIPNASASERANLCPLWVVITTSSASKS